MVQLLPQEGDVDLHIVVLCVGLIAPDLQQQLLLGDDQLLVQHQHLHHVELLPAEPHGALAAGEGEGGLLQPQVSVFQGISLPQLRLAAGQGPDAGQQLLGLKGLGEIVVRTGVQPVHPVRQLGPGREHQHRRGAALRPQAAQHGEAVQLGQHHVQQDHVINGGQGVVQPRLAVVADVHRIAVQLQQVLEGGGQADLILHHQYAHEITSVCRIARRFCRQRHTGGSPGAPPWSDETDGKRDRVYSPVASAAVRPFSATERMVSTEAVSIW